MEDEHDHRSLEHHLGGSPETASSEDQGRGRGKEKTVEEKDGMEDARGERALYVVEELFGGGRRWR